MHLSLDSNFYVNYTIFFLIEKDSVGLCFGFGVGVCFFFQSWKVGNKDMDDHIQAWDIKKIFS